MEKRPNEIQAEEQGSMLERRYLDKVEVTWKDGWELGIKDKRVWVSVAFFKATYMTRSSVSLLYQCHSQSV